ncbi:AAA family ATPase [Nocardiopsis xinjiangensis]|uniref:AAA family ATPase n=1 Tax=Nocardiopsis xinjiangensis TaxID=124285 RepID=UPI00034726E5|nr:AAA family ATPase [Nocardiopsis xinjiangensis]
MIKRITYVKDFRCYQGWKQHPQAVDFQRLNVIYAPNGTGKSTLATLLSGVPDDAEWSHGAKFLIQPGAEETQEKVDGPGHWLWGEVCVFGAEYVRRNLRFDSLDAETGAPALMYFGEPSIEQKKQREQALERIPDLTKQIQDLENQYNKAENGRVKTLRKVGASAVNELSSFNPRFKRGFNARHVEAALHQPPTPLDELTRFEEQDRALLHGRAWKPVSEPTGTGLTTRDLRTRINDVRQRTAMSNVIEELAATPSRSDWVRTGLALHDREDTCLFCDSALSRSRISRLEEHFDEGYTRLESEITQLHERIGELHSQTEQLGNALPREAQFFEDLHDSYESAARQAQHNINEFLSHLGRLTKSLDEKRGAMFRSLAPLDEDAVHTLDISAFASLINEHNKRVDNQDADRAQAAERRFQRMLYDIRETWQGFSDEKGSLDKQIKTFEIELAGCQDVLKETPEQGMNPEHFLPTLNDDIAHMLRRRELSFDHVDGRYQVLRDGEPAQHLSEGEKTVIALLYFLQSLHEQGRDLERTIVVIDDPVSSLDDHLMKAVYSTLSSRLEPGIHCRQLFVFTHSTTFLRYWQDSLTRGKNRERWPENRTLHIMKSRLEQDPNNESRTVRRPVLDPVDLTGSELNSLGTEYALVFYRAAQDLLASLGSTSVEDDVQLATSTPNDARKILEHFFQFKLPKQGTDVTGALNEALKGNTGSVSVRRERLKAYVHNNSHRSPKGDDWQLIDPETRDALTDVFSLIQQMDPDHFNGMCTRLGLTDQVSLLTGQ